MVKQLVHNFLLPYNHQHHLELNESYMFYFFYTADALQNTLTGLRPDGKYGPTGHKATNNFALLDALTPNASSVAINVGLI